MMKIVICTTPIRPVPTDYPPFGSLAIIQALREAGYDPSFYDIDGLRPTFDEVINFFKKERPDIIGISAVVSTAFAYVRNLATTLRSVLPDTTIVLGRLIQPLDILWEVAGVRARSIDGDVLKQMYAAGCVALYYGFETGSAGMLKGMEKNLALTHNLNAARCTYEAGLATIYQLVLAMPGETHDTVSETIEMLKGVTEFLPNPPQNHLSVNYIQALPGTPVYEFARTTGLIGPRHEDEEAYLLRISDIDAADDARFLNFTSYPYLTVRTWKTRIAYETAVYWHRSENRMMSGSTSVH